jgi:hypothetical protein
MPPAARGLILKKPPPGPLQKLLIKYHSCLFPLLFLPVPFTPLDRGIAVAAIGDHCPCSTKMLGQIKQAVRELKLAKKIEANFPFLT